MIALLNARILVVEDESIVQFDLQSRLQRLGHTVVGLSSSGEDAVLQAAELKPDLVLMDIMLAGRMDGIEAAAIIQNAQAVPVLFLTANPGSLEKAGGLGYLPPVSKPFRTAELQAAIAEALTGG